MPPGYSARHRRIKAGVALWLTFVAGCVDIIGYLTLYHVFTAHMTGGTVKLAQNILDAHWTEAAKAACVVAAFLLGSVAGRTIIEIGARRRVRSIASATLLLEAGLIATVIPLAGSQGHPAHVLASLALLAAAMGVQTATLTRVGALTVHTTFVTGMLNKLAQVASVSAFLAYDALRGRQVSPRRGQVPCQVRFFFAIWVLYLAGAMTGTWVNVHWGIRSLLLPAAGVVMALAVDQVAPLSIEEERDQPEGSLAA